MTEMAPRLTVGDAWLLAALTERRGTPVSLRDLVHDYDWLNRAVPSFNELSYGLSRLVAAGLALSSGAGTTLTLQPTPRALEIRRAIRGHAVPGIERLVDATEGPDEDRSHGRLPGLSSEDLTMAVAAHSASVTRLGVPFIALARVLTWWQNRSRPRDIR